MTNVFIIAEAGVNHNGDLEIAKQLIEKAAYTGADAIKFQTFTAENLVTKEAKQAEYQIENTGVEESQYDMLKRLELSHDDHMVLIEACKKHDIEFMSSAFDIEAAHFLIDTCKIRHIKIGSGELTNAPMLLEIARKQTPVILSTGMGSLDEIRSALGVLSFGYAGKEGTPSCKAFESAYDENILKSKVQLLHCTSNYPAELEHIHLRAINALQDEFGLCVGYSDHTIGAHVSIAAVARGALVIEKHFTLDCKMEGPDHKASMEPDDFKNMVGQIRDIEIALGSDKKELQPSEISTKAVARKGVVTKKKITKGEIFTEENIICKRPEGSVSPFDYWDTLGTEAKQDYNADETL